MCLKFKHWEFAQRSSAWKQIQRAAVASRRPMLTVKLACRHGEEHWDDVRQQHTYSNRRASASAGDLLPPILLTLHAGTTATPATVHSRPEQPKVTEHLVGKRETGQTKARSGKDRGLFLHGRGQDFFPAGARPGPSVTDFVGEALEMGTRLDVFGILRATLATTSRWHLAFWRA